MVNQDDGVDLLWLRSIRDAAFEPAKYVKDVGEAYKRSFLKRDTRPIVREEWKRLKEAEKKRKGNARERRNQHPHQLYRTSAIQ